MEEIIEALQKYPKELDEQKMRSGKAVKRTLSSYDRLLELEENLNKINYDIMEFRVRRLGNKIEEYDNFILYYGQTPGKHGQDS
ncbi:hypothetical protein EVAR_57589_1 [Eumeta japonica]|uniref:Uncharacterized protein n=1 Tax=Eumeta variegata TaxID=151549 RepID=A0A4C1XYM3_EUMVA|nr:hypothetical protein EVAR_57589_1 [Eumeta japonica]